MHVSKMTPGLLVNLSSSQTPLDVASAAFEGLDNTVWGYTPSGALISRAIFLKQSLLVEVELLTTWPFPEMSSKYLSYSQCKVLGFFLTALMFLATTLSMAPTLYMFPFGSKCRVLMFQLSFLLLILTGELPKVPMTPLEYWTT